MSLPPKLPLTGGCSCGTVRYEISSFPLLLYACHCTDCQTASGSAFALNMPVKRPHLSVLRGKAKGWHRKSAAGDQVTTWFCEHCAARLFGDRETRPGITIIRAGTLDDTNWWVPAGQMFIRSAQPWIKLKQGPECYESPPHDFRTLGERWRAMWPEHFEGP